MADIDMIPREYRDGVRVRRTVRLAGMALAVVVAAAVLGSGALRWRGAALERQADSLQAATAQTQADSARDAALQADRTRVEQAATVLATLRRKGELAALAQGLDAALTDQVWLLGLHVERDIQALAPATTPTAAAVPALAEDFSAPATPGGPVQTWRLGSQLDLTGQATSYDAVTAFLSTLGRQHGIAGLRLVGSSMAADGHVIDFHATGTLQRPSTAP